MAVTLPRFALRNVLRHRRRSVLVVLAMAGGLFVLVFLKGLQDGFVAQRLETGLGLQVGHVVVKRAETATRSDRADDGEPATSPADEPATSPAPPTIDVERVRAVLVELPAVVASSARVRGHAFARSSTSSAGVEFLGVDAADEAATLRLPSTLVEGVFLEKARIGQLPPCVLGEPLAAQLDVRPGERLALLVEGRDGSLHAEAFRVGGIFRSGAPSLDRRAVYVERRAARRLLLVSGDADEVVLRLEDPARAPDVARALAARGELDGLVVQSWHEAAPELRSAMEMLRVVEAVRTIVLFVLVGLGALNAVAMSVFERRREFGVLMSIGMRPTAVLRLLVLEMALLATAGVVLGAGAAWVVTELWLRERGLDVSVLGARLPGALEGTSVIYPYLEPLHVATAAAWVALLSLAVLAWPAARLLRLDPAEALRDR